METEQNEQIGTAVVVDVDHRFRMLMRGRVEFLDQVDLAVEVPIRFASNEYAFRVVVLLDIGATVEVTVDGNLREMSRLIVPPPFVRPAVAVAIGGANILSVLRKSENSCRGTGSQCQDRSDPRDLFHRQKPT